MVETTEVKVRQPVDRTRRFRFIAITVGVCIVLSAGFAGLAAFGLIISPPVVSLVIEGLVSLATALSLAYVGGSVMDYNGQHLADYFSNKQGEGDG